MNEKKLKQKVNVLTFFVILSNVALLTLLFSSFRNKDTNAHFDEITVKRINVVSETGDSLRMVISNAHRQHSGIINGVALAHRERQQGIIFFNRKGDECGGLIYDGNDQDAGLVLSVDKYRDDQVMQLQYLENTTNSKRKYGLQLWDYPKEGTWTERTDRFKQLANLKTQLEQDSAYQQMQNDSLVMNERMFIGKTYNNNVGLFIKDKNGKPRIKIYIDNQNNPVIETLDNKGNKIN